MQEVDGCSGSSLPDWITVFGALLIASLAAAALLPTRCVM